MPATYGSDKCLVKRLCRFDRDAPPIFVHDVNASRFVLPLAEFETILDGCLDDASEAPLQYVQRDDYSWLKCRRPFHPLESILGLEEESVECSGLNHFVRITTLFPIERRRPTVPCTDVCSECCPDAVPNYSWIRSDQVTRRLKELENKGDRDCCPRETRLEWYDMRGLGADFYFPSSASCAHFLRCLLDARHDASPWVPTEPEPRDKDVVILVFDPFLAQEKLLEFRVSDACPSWFLHAVAKVNNLNSNLPWIDELEMDSEEILSEKAVIIVYRRLPPRDSLTVEHPLSKQQVNMTGCLWESSTVSPKDGSEPEVCYQIVAPPILDARSEYPNFLDALLQDDATSVMQREAMQIAHWAAWPEKQHYSSGNDTGDAPWTVFPICHCFPAHDLSKKVWVPSTCAFVPRTVELIQKHCGNTLRTALFSRLDPDAVLNAHTGWSDLANNVLRIHIPLILPQHGNLCGVWVDGCVETHKPGRALCFDDSKIHRAYNYSSEARIVLILDLVRPGSMPPGSASGGHTDELDQYIEKMGLAR